MMRVSLLAIAASAVTIGTASACDYVGFNSVVEHTAAADAMFRGRAVQTRVLNNLGAAITTFEVEEWIKTPDHSVIRPNRIDVQHHTDSNMCGVTFEDGEDAFVIIGVATDGSLYTGEAVAPRWPESAYRAALLETKVRD